MSLKRPSQIIEENPGLKKHWTAQDIGQLFRMKLVPGTKLPGTRSGCMVEEKFILRLFRQIIAD